MIDPSIPRPRAAAGRPRRHLRLVSTDRPALETDARAVSSFAQPLEPAAQTLETDARAVSSFAQPLEPAAQTLETDARAVSSFAQPLEPAAGLSAGTSENAPGILTAGILKAIFCVMKMRLRMTASECLLAVPPDTEPLRRQLLRDRILECGHALDELHAALMPDIVRLHEIERELLVVRADLTRT